MLPCSDRSVTVLWKQDCFAATTRQNTAQSPPVRVRSAALLPAEPRWLPLRKTI